MKTMKWISMACAGLLTMQVIASEKPNFEVARNNSCLSGKGTELKGQVLDKITHEPLVGAKVKLVDCNMEVYTDFDGNFSFDKISEGDHIIQVEYVSYETRFSTITLSEDIKNSPVIFLKNVRN
ncbi:MAG: carboxypeptidase-like regulatory domain-containing protein [Bacteroidales bacterium]|nr:carboxypeptidase-like regulatory domain-containing protein [Bacteroidales bacterium]